MILKFVIYGWNACGIDEFYDLENDPYEQKNSIGDPTYESESRKLRAKLLDWMNETKNPARKTYERYL